MEFAKRAQASLLAAMNPARSSSGRRRFARTALAGLVLGFGGVTAGTSFVQASERGGLFDFFGQLFGAPPARRVEIRATPEGRRLPRRYSSLPDARHIDAPRPRHFTPRPVPLVDARVRSKRLHDGRKGGATLAANPVPTLQSGRQSVCVRTCDGYMFPLGMLYAQKDVPLHQAACAAACPDAPTALFTLPAGRSELDQIVSLKGQPYLAAAWANVYRRRRVENCHCRKPGAVSASLSIDRDPTVRVGDIVATKQSANVVMRLARGDVGVEDYRKVRSLSRGARRAIDRQIGALRRDADERAFRRSLRTVDAGNARVRFAEAKSARIRMGSIGKGFDEPMAAVPGVGFTPVRVLVPSPFER